MKIDFANLQLQYQKYKNDIDDKILSVLNKSNFILGNEVKHLEQNLESFSGVKHAVACSSGTDALILALMAININPDDEIITTPFTWVSTAETISFLKAKPVFVDIDSDTFNMDVNLIEKSINKKTKAIMPVSLFGQPADLDKIQILANKHNLKVIIDGAQSFGSKYKNKFDSNLGDISITSFYPSKPFGCYGDGGSVFTNDDYYFEKIKMLRAHGQYQRNKHKYIGICGRMDTIQAAVLLAKFPHFPKELKARERVAKFYTHNFSKKIKVPIVKADRTSTWAQYTIRVKNRDFFQEKLQSSGIPTYIFYPLPLHLQECFKYLNYKLGDFPIAEKASKEVISIPINSFLTDNELNYISSIISEHI